MSDPRADNRGDSRGLKKDASNNRSPRNDSTWSLGARIQHHISDLGYNIQSLHPTSSQDLLRSLFHIVDWESACEISTDSQILPDTFAVGLVRLDALDNIFGNRVALREASRRVCRIDVNHNLVGDIASGMDGLDYGIGKG